MGIVVSAGENAKREEVESSSVEKLEARQAELHEQGMELERKSWARTYGGKPTGAARKAGEKFDELDKESKLIVAELKKKTGKEYETCNEYVGPERFKAHVGIAMDASRKPEKQASVVKRAVAGGVIAGEAGAAVGALSAVDENNRNKK